MEQLGGTVIFLVVAIVLFFVFRGVFLWYYRINDIVELLKEQNKYLQSIAGMKPNTSQKNPNVWECPKCKTENPNSTFTCEKCGYKVV